MIQHFFNCDWGTSRFRLRLIHLPSGGIVTARSADQGAAKLAANAAPDLRPSLFRAVLEQHIAEIAESFDAPLRDIPVVISGMASSSMGWYELPYASLPFSLAGRDLLCRRLDAPNDEGRPVYLCSGVRSDRDVMRGEEIELIGLAALLPNLLQQDQEPTTVVLPGTHSKHVSVANGQVVDFHTHMTGELYDLLSSHSSLRHPQRNRDSAANGSSLSAENETAFCEGVEISQQAPLTASLFQVRVRQLLQGSDAPASAALLSGILIGSELSALARQQTGEGPIVLCAASPLNAMYQHAFEVLGLTTKVKVIPPTDVERLSALGQSAALRHLQNPSAAAR